LEVKRIAFDDMPWEVSAAGVRFKVHHDGERQLRLLEFTRELEHPHWCETGHLGFVLEGAMQVEFADGSVEEFRAGDGVAIPGGEAEKHRPRALTDRVRLVFVELFGELFEED
jgi:mannose-6-phosphate isomerase-like protein (cupin superfamily)